jgi:iron only hydrogenase large subunit-like protein
VKKSRCPYHFVEVMACPSGCVNGGGQAKAPNESSADGRARVLRVAEILHDRDVRPPDDAPLLQLVYR